MKLNTPEIAWHEKKPILGIDFSKVGSKCRLASAGADNDVKVRIKYIIENFVLILQFRNVHQVILCNLLFTDLVDYV